MYGTGGFYDAVGHRKGIRRRFEEISESENSERRGQTSFERNLFGQLTNKRQRTLAETLASLHLGYSSGERTTSQHDNGFPQQRQEQPLRDASFLYGAVAAAASVPRNYQRETMDIDNSESDRFELLSETSSHAPCPSSSLSSSSAVYSEVPSVDSHPLDQPASLWRVESEWDSQHVHQPATSSIETSMANHTRDDYDYDQNDVDHNDPLPPTIVPRVKSVYGQVPSLRDFFVGHEATKQNNSLDRLYRHYQYATNPQVSEDFVDPSVCRQVVVFHPVTRLLETLCERQVMHMRQCAAERNAHQAQDDEARGLPGKTRFPHPNQTSYEDMDTRMEVDAARVPSASGNLSHSEWFLPDDDDDDEEQQRS